MTCFSDPLDSRIKPDGPPVLHELATNAAKYGALSNDSGRVEIHWTVNGEFTLSWTECGGPDVVPPKRRGFGSTVVKTMA
jgi:two-component sensor histidine kinase